jgi:cell division protein FtsB
MSTELIFENAQLKGRVIALDAEVKCLEAVIRSHERVDCLLVKSLKEQLLEADRKIHGLQQDNEQLQNTVDRLEADKS